MDNLHDFEAFVDQFVKSNSTNDNSQSNFSDEELQDILQSTDLDISDLLPIPSNQSLLSNETNIGLSPLSPLSTIRQIEEEMANSVGAAALVPVPDPVRIEIIAQPNYGPKLRYRSDYSSNMSRKGFLGCTNRHTYAGPTIRIPAEYLNTTYQLYIRVGLITVDDVNGRCYVHPYELENLPMEFNDPVNNAVWFPITNEDVAARGIKSFTQLRIVKQTAAELKSRGPLRVFDVYSGRATSETEPQLSAKETIKKFNLDNCRLTFAVGWKINNTDDLPTEIGPDTTVFSNIMTGSSSNGDTNEETDEAEPSPPLANPIPIPRMYKYAPKRGRTIGGDEILIFYTMKIDVKHYGDLKVVFQGKESDTDIIFWSEPALEIDVKDRMVSFKAPPFNGPMSDIPFPVDIILAQDQRELESLKYYYLPMTMQCPTCRLTNSQQNPMTLPVANPNKRSAPDSNIFTEVYDDDSVVPAGQSTPEYRHSNSEPVSTSSNVTMTAEAKMAEKLKEATESFFTKNDLTPLLRFFRSTLKTHPENLLQTAIINGDNNVIKQFLPAATLEILRRRNDKGETALLLAARLNRTSIVEQLLDCKNGEALLLDVDNENQNILHIVASNLNCDETLELIIEHLRFHGIDIAEKFDKLDNDKRTPLQSAICKNNLSATRCLLPCLNKNVCQLNDNTGDNLVHLAVKHGNLALLQYLIDGAKLIDQGRQSNTSKTPLELARSLKHVDMIEYLNQKYPPVEINDSEESSTDENE